MHVLLNMKVINYRKANYLMNRTISWFPDKTSMMLPQSVSVYNVLEV